MSDFDAPNALQWLDALAALRQAQPNHRLLLMADRSSRRELAARRPDAIFAGMHGSRLAAHDPSADLYVSPAPPQFLAASPAGPWPAGWRCWPTTAPRQRVGYASARPGCGCLDHRCWPAGEVTCRKNLQVVQTTKMKYRNSVEYKDYFRIGAIFAQSSRDLIPNGLGVHCNCNCNAITLKIGLFTMIFSTKSGLIAGGLLAMSAWAHAAPMALITNGDFESGLTGWTVADLAGGSGTWLTIGPGANTPSGHTTSGAGGSAHGNQIAVTDQTGPGTHSLLQSFTVAPGASSVMLNFDMFVNSYGGGPLCGPGLNHTGGAVECGRVDILSSAASAFDTGGGVLANLYLGSDNTNTNPNPFTTYTFDITSIVGAGGNFQLRFAEADNRGFFNQGVDNVSLTAAAAVPEPATLALVGLALFGLRFGRRNKA